MRKAIHRKAASSGAAFFATAFLTITSAAAAEPLPADEIRASVEDHVMPAIALYREFLALPNDAQYPDDIEALVVWLEAAFADRGFETQRIETAGNPSLYAGRLLDPELPTVLIYLQADGQPVDPAAWNQANPFLAVLKERDADGRWVEIPWTRLEQGIDPDWRIFARSASDSKGPMTQFMVAMDLMDRLEFTPAYNLKVLIDTEEEMGYRTWLTESAPIGIFLPPTCC